MDGWSFDEYLAVMAIDFLALLLYAIWEWAIRPHYRRVSHRELRVASARRGPTAGIQRTIHAPAVGPQFWRQAYLTESHLLRAVVRVRPTTAWRGSAEVASGESQPASGTLLQAAHPGAGLDLQVGLSRLDRGAADRTPGVQPQPAPDLLSAHQGAGPKPLATAAHVQARSFPDDGGQASTLAGTSGPRTLVPAGSHPASGPETDAEVGAPSVGVGAPAVSMSQSHETSAA